MGAGAAVVHISAIFIVQPHTDRTSWLIRATSLSHRDVFIFAENIGLITLAGSAFDMRECVCLGVLLFFFVGCNTRKDGFAFVVENINIVVLVYNSALFLKRSTQDIICRTINRTTNRIVCNFFNSHKKLVYRQQSGVLYFSFKQ